MELVAKERITVKLVDKRLIFAVFYLNLPIDLIYSLLFLESAPC